MSKLSIHAAHTVLAASLALTETHGDALLSALIATYQKIAPWAGDAEPDPDFTPTRLYTALHLPHDETHYSEIMGRKLAEDALEELDLCSYARAAMLLSMAIIRRSYSLDQMYA